MTWIITNDTQVQKYRFYSYDLQALFFLSWLGPHAKTLLTSVRTQSYAHFATHSTNTHITTFHHPALQTSQSFIAQTYNSHRFRAMYILIQKDISKIFQNQTRWQTKSYAGWLTDGVKNMAW